MKLVRSSGMSLTQLKKHAAMLSGAERQQLITFLTSLESEDSFQQTITQRMKVMDAGLKLIREEMARHEKELQARLSP